MLAEIGVQPNTLCLEEGLHVTHTLYSIGKRYHRIVHLHRFLIAQNLANGQLRLSDPELLYQWKKVLRLKSNDRIILLDGLGFEADAVIESLAPSFAQLTVSHLRGIHT